MLGLGTLRRVAGELRRDVAAAHERDPAARGVSSLEILAAWPGVQALLAHRVAESDGSPAPAEVVLLRHRVGPNPAGG
jgi:serine O-acetyltransferase